jgi:predicted Zn finger-like uncharacterized protein
VIAACPQCRTRFRLSREKLGPQGARIRCSSCQTVFRVQAPDGGSPPTPVESRPAAPALAPAPRVVAAPPPAPKPLPPLARALVLEADAALGKAIVERLERWRIGAQVVSDGGDGLVQMFRDPPELAILGADLPGIRAPQIAELVKRSSETAAVKLIRVAVRHEPPSGGYDAEDLIEPGDLPGGVDSILSRIGVGAAPAKAPATPAPAPTPAAAPAAAPKPAARPPAAASAPAAPKPAPARPVPSADPDIAAAERLARIAVSDVILYNEAKFAAAAAAGNVAKALASEIEEARQHFNSRVAAALRGQRDFLIEELERRAAARKG